MSSYTKAVNSSAKWIVENLATSNDRLSLDVVRRSMDDLVSHVMQAAEELIEQNALPEKRRELKQSLKTITPQTFKVKVHNNENYYVSSAMPDNLNQDGYVEITPHRYRHNGVPFTQEDRDAINCMLDVLREHACILHEYDDDTNEVIIAFKFTT